MSVNNKIYCIRFDVDVCVVGILSSDCNNDIIQRGVITLIPCTRYLLFVHDF